MKEMGNPFQEESKDLFPLDTYVIANSIAAEMVATHYQNGRIRFNAFMKGLGNGAGWFFLRPNQEK